MIDGVFVCVRGEGVSLSTCTKHLLRKAHALKLNVSHSRTLSIGVQAFITLNGSMVTSKEMQLAEPGRQSASFKRNEEKELTVRGIDVGTVYSVDVRIVSLKGRGCVGEREEEEERSEEWYEGKK